MSDENEILSTQENRWADYNRMCEKPTPLGVGWIAQRYIIVCI